MRTLIDFMVTHEWAWRLFGFAVLAAAYAFAASRIGKRQKQRDDLQKYINEITANEWELEQMVVPYSGHGLAQKIDDTIACTFKINKNNTFEAMCILNTYTGTWEITDAPAEGEKVLDEPHIKFDVQRTTANEGDANILRSEKYFVRMLRKTDIARTIHANTHLLLCDREGQVIGLFHEKAKEYTVVFKK